MPGKPEPVQQCCRVGVVGMPFTGRVILQDRLRSALCTYSSIEVYGTIIGQKLCHTAGNAKDGRQACDWESCVP